MSYKTIEEMKKELEENSIDILEETEVLNKVKILVYKKGYAICVFRYNYSIPYSEEIILNIKELEIISKYIQK